MLGESLLLHKNAVLKSLAIAGSLLATACEWPRQTKDNPPAAASVDSIAAQPFDGLSYKGSEAFLTLIPLNIGTTENPQICLYQVDFLRQALDNPGSLNLLRHLVQPLNAFAFTQQDFDDLAEISERQIQNREQRQAVVQEAKQRGKTILRNVLVGLGQAELPETCESGTKSTSPSWLKFLEAPMNRFKDAKRRENQAIFGPLAPLFARATDASTIEPLPTAEYLLILDRIKRYALPEDLSEAAKRTGISCYERPFPLEEQLSRLREIAEAFPPAKPVPGLSP